MLNPYTGELTREDWPCLTFRIKCHEVALFFSFALCTPPLLPAGDMLRRKPELPWTVMKCHCVITACLTYMFQCYFWQPRDKTQKHCVCVCVCARANTLNSIHVTSRHNSVPEMNVVSRLKFSKSVFSYLMLIWAKRNQLVLLEDTAAICSSTAAFPPTPTFSIFPVLLHSYIQTNHGTGSKSQSLPPASSTAGPRVVYDGSLGFNIVSVVQQDWDSAL